MSLAKVWNDNVHPFKQKWRGQIIEIPAKSFIEMEYTDAVEFKSSYSPPIIDGQGERAEGFKMIRVEGRSHSDERVVAYRSHLDGSLYSSKSELDAHLLANAHRVASDPEAVTTRAKTSAKKQPSAEN